MQEFNTGDFIAKYCYPNDLEYYRNKWNSEAEIQYHWNTLLRDYNRENVNHNSIRMCLYGMDYQNYLRTPWWQIISRRTKQRDQWQCRENSNHRHSLEVHHLTYEFRGMEVKGMHTLITLCDSCHRAYHELDKLARHQDWEIMTSYKRMPEIDLDVLELHRMTAMLKPDKWEGIITTTELVVQMLETL